ncbi:TolB-like 6-blade propeller-like [Cyclobacterium lianum]|uniref:TolB-like 6-blade propeller-like n=1 Tax=Cyclobacterium lianum TaxID=388280 RepID=A0A1M7IKY7_9BACT|nr:BF3164 family lipoprotein [Cyclobacterium lianum]SHM41482.1 TolB-like 6-blade propeller-like [Cyclobacterium lianum]
MTDLFTNTASLSIKGTSIEINENDEIYFTQMWEMTYAEGVLIIRDKDLTHYFKVFNLNSGEITKLGQIGDGPKELQTDYTRASYDAANHLVYLSNFPFYYAYSVDSMKNNGNPNPLYRLKIDPQDDILIESTISSGFVIGAMFKKRFGLYRLEDDYFSSFGEYEQGTYMSNQCLIFPNPLNRKAVRLERASEAFTILDYSDGNLSLVEDFKGWSSEQIETEESGGMVRAVSGEDAKYCFVSGATSEKYIYALYSGNLRSATEFIDPALANIVYVFDWKGNPVKKLTLDHLVRSIAIDEENQILYAAAFIDKDLGLIKYDLR